MPPKEAIVLPSVESDEDGQQYSFAVEYIGPPVTYDLPRAVPINVEKIPVAAVVSKVPLSNTEVHIPVVPPILAPDRNRFSKELLLQPTVSPTSVIAFQERVSADTNNCLLSGELSSYESGELAELSNNSDSSSRRLVACSVSNEHWSKLDSCDSPDKPRGSSSLARISIDDDLNQPDWGSNESVLSLDYPSSRVSSLKTGDCNNESNGDVRRPQVVTFRDIESDDGLDEEFSQDEVQAQIVRVKRQPQTKGKKGSCYRCFKGNRFTEKEVCIVCDAKYCNNCVLRAMGSMPEGRKCVTCIGFPIDESKRGGLGKCSRMLKRFLNDLEVRQILKAEKLCEANQLPPEYICVNGQPLCYEELAILQSCPNPPKTLKPGNYWYDKVSGLWGKEGQKPSKIISPHLNVGGPIRPDASNGNTEVFINGREITKVELRMLQLAGVQVAGNPHFWVNEDGSYLEEGQKNTKGYIWGKAGTKLVCAVLSLPVPSKSSNSCGESLNSMNSRSVPDYLEQRTLQKILLVGSPGSGSTTIFKQAKILYKNVPFSEDERENIKLKIQTNVYGYLGMLLEGRERFEEECLAEMRKGRSSKDIEPEAGSSDDADRKNVYSIGPRLKSFSDFLLKTMVSGNLEVIFPAATREYAPLVEELWKHTAIQETYNRRSELVMLPSVASYYLERVFEILKTDYEPSDLDILYAEGVTSSNGLACVNFSFPQSSPDENIDTADQHDSLLRYQLIRVLARGFGENCKWLEMFEDVGMVIFCVALSDYDQFSADGTNKMLLSRKFFETIVTHPTFDQMDFLLILNKLDVFEEKIERVPLTRCEWFDDFHPLISRYRTNTNSNSINNNPTPGQLAFHYIAVKFKRLYSSLTGRKLYVSHLKGLEPNSVDSALKYAREILKWNEERANFSFSFSEHSFYSTEASSLSH
ncbi:Extra-large guanine nucleotide-binding protein 1 [Hibiscus syriacus]|uniref:Extra-large guanine nucleotide-binding protein 1 n=1 Tax=Hibiscus syriacus TaxID=106335 RepID=A0A6A3B2R7_HIBSY|nr:extra-large guanine nucleotide-binding protein 1-like isoform X1 [Hibiscus syriacus]KAE8709542.1 Extra-large guanine nucleotide-binding protein 1 [Hibiscus syriacus]